MTPVRLAPLDLGLAAALLLIAAALSFGFRLGLERRLAVSAVRMVVQLLLVGLVLKFVFEQTSVWVTAAVGAMMIAFAAVEASARTKAPQIRRRFLALGGGTLLVTGVIASIYTVAVVIGPTPWHAPRYLLPILGMILGNALTAVALVFETLASEVQQRRRAIEARLALGAERRTALAGPLRNALRTGLTPILNSMAVTGVVSLPGMMSGQVIAGVDPIEAAKYQIMIMCVLAGATALAALAAGVGGVYLLTDARHRLRLDRLAPAT